MSSAVRTFSIDEDQLRKEREESKLLVQQALAAAHHAEKVANRIARINAIYRERLVGTRRPNGGQRARR